jgi:hypothetical protein
MMVMVELMIAFEQVDTSFVVVMGVASSSLVVMVEYIQKLMLMKNLDYYCYEIPLVVQENLQLIEHDNH